MENKCHKATYNQEIGLLNFDVFSERKKLLLTLRTQIEEISNMLSPKKKIISSDMQYRKEIDTNFHFTFFYTSHVVIFTVKVKLPRIVISILLHYFTKLLFRKYLFFSVRHSKTCLYS